jgi:hypothetical protein
VLAGLLEVAAGGRLPVRRPAAAADQTVLGIAS